MKVYGSFECGYTDNRALYATFGYERQLWTCNQAIFGVDGRRGWSPDDHYGYLTFKFEFAPIYSSIKTINKRENGKVELGKADIEKYRKNGIVVPNDEINRLTYELIRSPLDSNRILEIDGSSEYVNWYKNGGSRLYYLEDYPVREMYIGWLSKDERHSVLVGRMKNLLSFDEQDMIWREDAWFAPMSHWILKEIYSGIKYSFKSSGGLIFGVAAFSGDGNPTKNGIYYIDNSGSPNKKTNNTPTLEFNIKDTLVSGRLNCSVFFGMERGTIGSVWDVAIGEGKHNKNILATGVDAKYYPDYIMLNSVRVYFQYTKFKSGLRSRSNQNTGNPAFKDIVQNGFFVGVDFTLGQWFVFRETKLGVAYELFDRYDYRAHVYSVGKVGDSEGKEGKECLRKYIDSKQSSFIVNASFLIRDNISLNLGMNLIKDPLHWISDVLETRGSNRYKLSIGFHF
jgi:hypothetical protein